MSWQDLAMSFPWLRQDVKDAMAAYDSGNYGGYGGYGGYGYGRPGMQGGVNMGATASSTPVQLMQKFVNSRGWGNPVDTSGMYDWRGNMAGSQPVAANAPAAAPVDRWTAFANAIRTRR
jgi:hypothetical protein